jgi:hypothetical protein
MNTQIVHVNDINRPSVKKYGTAIIRAYGNEPVRLNVAGSDGVTIDVFGNDSNQIVSFPIQWAYKDNEDKYAELTAAYKIGDSEKLIELWKSARRFDEKT